jgi:hypothetical protein
MKLQSRFHHRSRPLSIAEAVEQACYKDHDDTLTRMQDSLDATSKMLGRLTMILHEKGVLSDDDVQAKLLDGLFARLVEE